MARVAAERRQCPLVFGLREDAGAIAFGLRLSPWGDLLDLVCRSLTSAEGRLEDLLAVAGVGGVEVDAGLDDLVDAVEHRGVEHDISGGKLTVELLHGPRSDDRRGHGG